jgi:hypothetical protein
MTEYFFGVAFGIVMAFAVLFISIMNYAADTAEKAYRDGWENPFE